MSSLKCKCGNSKHKRFKTCLSCASRQPYCFLACCFTNKTESFFCKKHRQIFAKITSVYPDMGDDYYK